MTEPPLLNSLSEEDRRRVMAIARLRRFGKGEVVFHEGDPADTLHLIRKGRVAVQVVTSLGEVLTLAVLEPGDVFGELALVGAEQRRTASVVALERTETLALHRADFEDLRRAHPGIERFLVDMLARHVTRLSSQLMEATYASAERRVVLRLLDLATVYGDEIPLTQEVLASLAGTSRVTVNRVLRAAQKAGTVRLRRGRITLLRRDRLARQAG